MQKMAPAGTEVIVGMSKDAQFGPVLMFGLGGILVEVLKDVAFRIVPLEPKDARQMVREIKGFPVLEGVRGQRAGAENLRSLDSRSSNRTDLNRFRYPRCSWTRASVEIERGAGPESRSFAVLRDERLHRPTCEPPREFALQVPRGRPPPPRSRSFTDRVLPRDQIQDASTISGRATLALPRGPVFRDSYGVPGEAELLGPGAGVTWKAVPARTYQLRMFKPWALELQMGS